MTDDRPRFRIWDWSWLAPFLLSLTAFAFFEWLEKDRRYALAYGAQFAVSAAFIAMAFGATLAFIVWRIFGRQRAATASNIVFLLVQVAVFALGIGGAYLNDRVERQEERRADEESLARLTKLFAENHAEVSRERSKPGANVNQLARATNDKLMARMKASLNTATPSIAAMTRVVMAHLQRIADARIGLDAVVQEMSDPNLSDINTITDRADIQKRVQVFDRYIAEATKIREVAKGTRAFIIAALEAEPDLSAAQRADVVEGLSRGPLKQPLAEFYQAEATQGKSTKDLFLFLDLHFNSWRRNDNGRFIFLDQPTADTFNAYLAKVHHDTDLMTGLGGKLDP